MKAVLCRALGPPSGLVLEDVPVVVLYLQNAFDSLVTRLHDYPLYPPVSALALRHAWLSEE